VTTHIPVVEKITKANDEIAAINRRRLDEAGVVALNMMASPGAGKTSLIEQTVPRLREHLAVGVIGGDIATTLDAERATVAGATAVQITTGGACHLDAPMVRNALAELPLEDLDLLIVENVGNLICPASFALGTHANVLVASVPEGDDKPYKHPRIYRGVDVLVVNKIDLLPYVDFDMKRFRTGVKALNEELQSFDLSCRTGEGIEPWTAWITERVRAAAPAAG
jgi:hydrogenase nickel incorporation protein HypB